MKPPQEFVATGLRALFLVTLVLPGSAWSQQVTLVAGGDMEKSPRPYAGPAAYVTPADQGIAIPYLNLEGNRDAIRARLGRNELDGPGGNAGAASAHYLQAMHQLKGKMPAEEARRHGFQKVGDLLRNADIAFANMEMPLSNNRCKAAATCGEPGFADALKWAGFDVISIANNRVHDAETIGLLDTMDSLTRAGVGWVGAGRNLEAARKPLIVDRNGLKLAFFGYTYGTSAGIDGFVLPGQPGAMPMDPLLIREDIKRVRSQVDFVVLSLHWGAQRPRDTAGKERFTGIDKVQRNLAHELIDAGADVILGHHPHVPQGVEVYKHGVVFYSFGNFMLGHGHDFFLDNFAARLTLARASIPRIEILPLAGKGMDIIQPYVLQGDRAQALLRDIQALSAQLDTTMAIEGGIGVIKPPVGRPAGSSQ